MNPFKNPYDEEQSAAMSEINITPFIDVMLVLLIIFMVAAPLMMGGVHINLPKTSSAPMPRPSNPIIVSIDADSRIFVDKDEVTSDNRHIFFKELALSSETGEVFVRGDGDIKYATMMNLMSELGQAGFSRVTLVAAIGGPPSETAADHPEALTTPGEIAEKRVPAPLSGKPQTRTTSTSVSSRKNPQQTTPSAGVARTAIPATEAVPNDSLRGNNG